MQEDCGPGGCEMEETISVIVPVYNVEAFLPKCLDSVTGQTYRNLEILLIDDGSTDSSGQICDQYARKDSRIRVIHQENQGLAAARNTGLDEAAGAYVAFVDSDDWIDRDMYEFLYRLMHEHGADLAICRLRRILSSSVVDGSTGELLVCDGLTAFEQMVRGIYPLGIGVFNKLYKKDLVEGLRFPSGKLIEDLYFTPHVLYRCEKCVYQDTAKYNYLQERPGSIMNAPISSKRVADELQGYLEIERFFKEENLERHASLIKEYHTNSLLDFYYQIQQSDLKEKEAVLEALRLRFRENTDGQGGKAFNRKTRMKVYLFARSPAFYGSLREVAKTARSMRRQLKDNLLQ